MKKFPFPGSSAVRLLFVLAMLGLGRDAAVLAQIQYTGDGTPTALEEAIRWRVNRGRFDAVGENQARGTTYSDVPESSGPLAPAQSLTLSSRHHSEDMAKNNVFQHATPAGSAYYDPVTQPAPWDRMLAEGYSWTTAAENIAAGYTTAEAVYLGWWNSSSHRHNMYDSDLREIGNGHFFWADSAYHDYYTMDLGNAPGKYFFTDTLFRDANGNGAYDEGEGVENVAIKVMSNGLPNAYDISSPTGSFAIPIESLAGGTQVQLVLSNGNTAPVTLTLPRNYSSYTTFSLGPRESRAFGTFIQPTTAQNVGFAEVSPREQTTLAIVRDTSGVQFSWTSETGVSYRMQWSTDLANWVNLTDDEPGTGGTMTARDPGMLNARKFYRLAILP